MSKQGVEQTLAIAALRRLLTIKVSEDKLISTKYLLWTHYKLYLTGEGLIEYERPRYSYKFKKLKRISKFPGYIRFYNLTSTHLQTIYNHLKGGN